MSKLCSSLLSMAQIQQLSTGMGGPLRILRRKMDMSTLCGSLLSMAQIRQLRKRMRWPACTRFREMEMCKLFRRIWGIQQPRQAWSPWHLESGFIFPPAPFIFFFFLFALTFALSSHSTRSLLTENSRAISSYQKYCNSVRRMQS